MNTRPGDAAILYELAQATDGPILEIGTYRGKSAILMALAVADAQRMTAIFTLDVDIKSLGLAFHEADHRGVGDRLVFVHGTVSAFARAYPHMRPALVFVDGDHSRRGVERDLAVLKRIVPAGGQVLFHDFADPRNDDPTCTDTKVRPAVEASWVARQCDFLGTFGISGLYVRRDAPESASRRIADLMPLDSARTQYVHRLRNPTARRLRRLTSRVRQRLPE